MNNKRPLSPHLQIYRLPFPAILSITHRFTGIVLFSGSLLLSLWIFALAIGEKTFNIIKLCIHHPIGQIILIGYSLALFYHALNGVRHLSWDLSIGMELSSIYKTGIAVVALALFLTTLFWLKIYI